ncbi:MAG: glycosyltransferase family 39 protein [Planctomycetales bacterium]|nr:glycosyltransferase family 39 protein [Planctomycetales bacterium]
MNEPDSTHCPPDTPRDPEPLNWPVMLGLVGVLLVSFVLRVWQINEPLWVDELHTSWTIQAGWSEVPGRAALGNQSPVYFWMTRFSVSCLGESEWALRMPSLIGGLLFGAALFAAVRRWTGSNMAGLAASALAAVDRTSLFYAGEARSFAWIQTLAVLHVFVFSELVQRPTLWRRVAFVGGGAALFYLHYTAVLLLLAEVAWFALVDWGWRRAGVNARYGWRQLLTDLAAMLVAMLPAAASIRAVIGRRENWQQFVGQPEWWEPLTLFPLHVYVLLPLLLVGVAAMWMRRRGAKISLSRVASAWLLIAVWYAVPVLVAWIATRQEIAAIFFPRYLLVCSPAPLVFAAVAIAAIPGRWLQVAAIVLLLIASVEDGGLIAQLQQDGRLLADRQEDWRAATKLLDDPAEHPAAPVLLYAGLIEARQYLESGQTLKREYATFPLRGMYRIDDADNRLFPLASGQATLETELFDKARKHGGVWLVARLPLERTANWEAAVGRRLRTAGVEVASVERHAFGNVSVVWLSTTKS